MLRDKPQPAGRGKGGWERRDQHDVGERENQHDVSAAAYNHI